MLLISYLSSLVGNRPKIKKAAVPINGINNSKHHNGSDPKSRIRLTIVAQCNRIVAKNIGSANKIVTPIAASLVELNVETINNTNPPVIAPITTMASLDFAGLIGGAIITETIFNLPGLGRLTLRSVVEFDLPIVVATTILAAGVVIIMNLIVDVAYAFLDPRIRY